MKKLFLLFFTLIISLCSCAKETPMIGPRHPAVRIEGRHFIENNKAIYCMSGVSVSVCFKGTSVSGDFTEGGTGDETGTNYLAILLDGKEQKVIPLKPGNQKILLLEGLDSSQSHVLTVFKRTECAVGNVVFNGFKVEGQALPFAELNATKKRIEFIGNSLTCGYGNEISIPAPPQGQPNTGFHSKNENHLKAWGKITADSLGFAYQCVAYSGRGLYRNNSGSTEGTVPAFYDKIIPDDAASPLWDAKLFMADIVVIDLGTNDFAPESRGDFVDEALYVKTYVAFIAKLRTLYPKAQFICVTGNAMSDYWPEGRNCWTRIQTLTKQVVNESNAKGDDHVHYFRLSPQQPPYGEDWHPSIATHESMAAQIIPFIRSLDLN
jgi:hypothetical protein